VNAVCGSRTFGRLRWSPIVARAAEIVNGYDIPVTLRQLFYRLVMERLIPNSDGAYKGLSKNTVALRRSGEFPRLVDRSRKIIQPASWNGPALALDSWIGQYRRDRSEGQAVNLFIGVEKNALAGLLEVWFDEIGIPVLPLGGYSSDGLDVDVRDAVVDDGRPAVLVYAGDFDASGMDIGRSFIDTTNCWAHTVRVALSPEQIETLGLPVLQGKSTDTRAPKFIERYAEMHTRHDFGVDERGRRYPVQVELDALDPDDLYAMFNNEVARFWDMSVFDSVLRREEEDMSTLRTLAAQVTE
jgi:hypothetical protein